MTSANRTNAPIRFLVFLVSCFLLSSCNEKDPPRDHLAGAAMGTTYSVRLATPLPWQDADAMQARIDERLEEIEASMSTYRPGSEISRFNARHSTDWIPVSPEFAELVASAQDLSQRTGGAFDITIGPLVELWGFGAAGSAPSVPPQEQLDALRIKTGFSNLEVRSNPPALRKSREPALQIDLSGIAKGFAVDEVAELLEAFRIRSYLVEIGGEVRVGAAKPDGSAWRVGIENPRADERSVQRVIEITDTALATSGDYRNFFEAEGVRYSHLIDPRTGRPSTHSELGSVSVLARSCREADALATALCVLGPDEGGQIARIEELAVLFLIRKDGEFSAIVTDPFLQEAGDPTKWTGNSP